MNEPTYVCDDCRDPKRGVATTCPGCIEVTRDKLQFLTNMLLDREDVRDGSDGTPLPNEAMSMLIEFEQQFGPVKR